MPAGFTCGRAFTAGDAGVLIELRVGEAWARSSLHASWDGRLEEMKEMRR